MLECPVNYELNKCSSKEYSLTCNTCFHAEDHVYCTDCIYVEDLFKCFTLDNINKRIPSPCNKYYPYDPENSKPFKKRPCYIPV